MKVKDTDRKKLDAFAWPGGYPIMYLASDGWREEDDRLDLNPHDRSESACCAKCAANVEEWPDLIIVGQYIHWEGPPEYCEWCSGFTESAYGDPAEKESQDEIQS